MPAPSRFARIALPVPLGKSFTYRVDDSQAVRDGARVLVELGRRKVLGVVLHQQATPPADVPLEKLKPILAVLDEKPCLPDELRSFLLELARYYFAPVGEVLRLALPALERKQAQELKATAGKLKAVGRLVQVARAVEQPSETAPPGLPDTRRKILEELLANGALPVSELCQKFSTARAHLKKLEAAGLVLLEKREKSLDPFFSQQLKRDRPPQLNGAQSAAVQAINAQLEQRTAGQFLLDGVTASGKTEVYLHAAAHALAMKRAIILLVPEIALTPQLVGRFRARLGDEIAVLHSALSEGARLSMWRKLREGTLRVVVGPRSALFAPVQDLGLICVDEEHDGSYKQEEGVRYNARDMALLRAHRANAVCVLGSATVSLSSVAQVRSGKMVRLQLPERAHKTSELPSVELIDLNRVGSGPSGDPLLSLPLHRAMEQNLAEKGQTILFLNRRGFSPSLICGGCGTISQCPHCSVALTLHRAGSSRLKCHYCDFSCAVPSHCDQCMGARFLEEGTGTERIEALLKEYFPQARVGRLDRDVAGGPKSEAIVSRMRAGELDILVGTQMVTKGHDLPSVTLVGVLNADSALSLPDFRAAERTFHLLVQVAGRAGRADRPGKVLIQTRSPEHPAVVAAKKHDVTNFIRHELKQRKELSYPPFSQIALVRLEGKVEKEVQSEAVRIARVAEKANDEIEILGPAAAPIFKVRDRYRFRFLIRSKTRAPLRESLLAVVRSPVHRRVRLSLDVDPLNML